MPLRRARDAGRSKPPEEHYAEAEGSSGRWTKAFPARRILLAAGPCARPFSSSETLEQARGMRSLTLCEKKTSQFATSLPRAALTARWRPPSVRLAPSTECPRLMTLRVAVASAEVSRIVGRRRHRLGAFSLDRRGRRFGCGTSAPNRHAYGPGTVKSARSQFAPTSTRPALDRARRRSHRVVPAPSTERPRLMALRVATASAEVSRIAGRERHRLGALLSCGCVRAEGCSASRTGRSLLSRIRSAECVGSSRSSARSSSSTRCCTPR